ncbi:MAG: hypothetical protein F6K19_01750 [Cyanothece sp. SIO1E1]|nr:hypothetical protein [Cyanothece sp. SIO1E1]
MLLNIKEERQSIRLYMQRMKLLVDKAYEFRLEKAIELKERSDNIMKFSEQAKMLQTNKQNFYRYTSDNNSNGTVPPIVPALAMAKMYGCSLEEIFLGNGAEMKTNESATEKIRLLEQELGLKDQEISLLKEKLEFYEKTK